MSRWEDEAAAGAAIREGGGERGVGVESERRRVGGKSIVTATHMHMELQRGDATQCRPQRHSILSLEWRRGEEDRG